MATIQIRIDEKTKRASKKTFEKMGLDLSGGIKFMLTQINLYKSIPFEPLTENGFTIRRERALLKIAEEAEAGKNLSGPMNGKEAVEYLRKLM